MDSKVMNDVMNVLFGLEDGALKPADLVKLFDKKPDNFRKLCGEMVGYFDALEKHLKATGDGHGLTILVCDGITAGEFAKLKGYLNSGMHLDGVAYMAYFRLASKRILEAQRHPEFDKKYMGVG